MPDHVHWLLQLRTAKTLSQVVQATKILCTKSINRKTGGKGSIWQVGFHDHAVRNDGALKEIARYVVANPIRAKLVTSVRDYPHWDAVWVNNADAVISQEIKVVPERPVGSGGA
jgi:REP element-mobilizing transposase RayT